MALVRMSHEDDAGRPLGIVGVVLVVMVRLAHTILADALGLRVALEMRLGRCALAARQVGVRLCDARERGSQMWVVDRAALIVVRQLAQASRYGLAFVVLCSTGLDDCERRIRQVVDVGRCPRGFGFVHSAPLLEIS